jgi:hypothetical protein
MAAADYKHLATISLRNFEDRKQEIAEQLFRSASTIGFFYIVGQPSSCYCVLARHDSDLCFARSACHICIVMHATCIACARMMMIIWIEQALWEYSTPQAASWCRADHGIAQEDIDRAFALGTQFFNLPEDVKLRSQFDPDTYLGQYLNRAAMHVGVVSEKLRACLPCRRCELCWICMRVGVVACAGWRGIPELSEVTGRPLEQPSNTADPKAVSDSEDSTYDAGSHAALRSDAALSGVELHEPTAADEVGRLIYENVPPFCWQEPAFGNGCP